MPWQRQGAKQRGGWPRRGGANAVTLSSDLRQVGSEAMLADCCCATIVIIIVVGVKFG